jgi:NADH-quinone oxidoreductase subunit L
MTNSNNLSLFVILINYKFYYSSYLNLNLIIGISLILCGWSKSAQLGFQPWLLDAMEGPTPVSALLHSATLITAGIILLYKNKYIFYSNNSLSILLLLLGGLSCFINSLSSIYFLDIKRIIAYSTCTHISLIIMIVSLDSIIQEISLKHLFLHGWSKSLLFISIGYLISILHSQDLRLFGSLFQSIPIFFTIINITLLTILGFPGSYISYSKDIILEFGLISVYGYNIIIIFFLILLLSQGYSLGLLFYLFHNFSYYNNSHNFYQLYKYHKFSYIFLFLIILFQIISLPYLLLDILMIHNINIIHHIAYFDPFSLLSLVGLFLAYYNQKHSKYFNFNIHNNKFYFDKIKSDWNSN